MQQLQGEIWMEFNDLLLLGVGENTIKLGIFRNSSKWQAIADPADRRRRLIRYNTLADKYKALIRTSLCGGLEPDEWLKLKEYEAEYGAKLDMRDSLSYKLEMACDNWQPLQYYYPGINGPQLKYLCRAAGVLEVSLSWYRSNGIPLEKYDPIKEICAWVLEHEEEFFRKKYVPTNPIRFKEKLMLIAQGAKTNEVIKLPRAGNQNRATMRREKEWQQIVVHLRIQPRNWSVAQICRKTYELCAALEIDQPSESTVRNFLREMENVTVAKHTDLNNKKRQIHRPSAPIAHASFSDECWEMDGTRVQLGGHHTGNRTAKGNKEVKSLDIIAVRDVYSGAYLGYWYGYGENANAYRCALRMAVEITGRLPYELRYDQFPGSNSKEWQMLEGNEDHPGLLVQAGVKLTKTSVATGKAKMERGFYTLQQVFESEMANYIGQGIKSSLSFARPNEAYIMQTQNKFLKQGWDFDQAWFDHASNVISPYNHTDRSVYSKRYKTLPAPWNMYLAGQETGPGTGRDISPEEISMLFWNSTAVGIRNNRLEVIIKGERHLYYVPSAEFDLLDYQRKGVKVVVKYDPWDMSNIMVFSLEGEFLAELAESELIKLTGVDADYEALAEWKKNQKEITEKQKAKVAEYELSEEVIQLLPTLSSKEGHQDALTSYAMRNVGEWKIPSKEERSKKSEKPLVTEVDIDIDALTRSQY